MKDDTLEELDLAIPDMDSAGAEAQVAAVLQNIPGVVEARLIERGAFIRYRAETISQEEICELVRRAGFRASTFQDSKSGKTGTSSQ